MKNDATQLNADILVNSEPVSSTAPVPNQRVFIVYNSYRTLVAACLLGLLIFPATQFLVSGFDRILFSAGCILLLATAFPLTGSLGRRVRGSETGIFGLMVFDLIAIALIIAASGGILSGFSVLYFITVAAAAVLLKTRILATVVSAIAVFAVLADIFWLVSRGVAELGMTVPAGVLGSLLFAVSFLVQLMTARVISAESIADDAESRVKALQQLNQQIVTHMKTGIALIGDDGKVTPINITGQRFLGASQSPSTPLEGISSALAHQYQRWCAGMNQKPEPFTVNDEGPALIASFAELDERIAVGNLLFIEDYTPVTQFAQSLKLNSLSQLTASIAHEIRNPLASVSHAAQLLSESETLPEADRLLSDIVVSNSGRINEIIHNVTEVSRRQAPKPERLELNRWLGDYCAEYSSQRPDDAPITLKRATESLFVSCDPAHLKRVLSNLFDNGLHHSLKGEGSGQVELRLQVDGARMQVNLDVVDSGPGVAETNISRLFEPFFTTTEQGSGLGLYLCKELCEINGVGLNYRRTDTGESAFRMTHDLIVEPMNRGANL